MITIEEKIKLFTKIVYDRVEKENRLTIDKFNEEFLGLLEEKKREFVLASDESYKRSKREIEKESSQILSKARVEAKKIILAEEKNLIDKTIKALYEYGLEYTKSKEYEEYFKRLLSSAVNELKNAEEITLSITKEDRDKFDAVIKNSLEGIKTEYEIDDSIIGGLVVLDTQRHIRIDMSLASKIMGSRDIIGQKIADILK